jgi:hypothetical protein
VPSLDIRRHKTLNIKVLRSSYKLPGQDSNLDKENQNPCVARRYHLKPQRLPATMCRACTKLGPEPTLADPDLARVVEAWPDLPEPIRRAVLALIGAAVVSNPRGR